jgi:hypothetical protein
MSVNRTAFPSAAIHPAPAFADTTTVSRQGEKNGDGLSAKEQKVLTRAAAPKHLGAAIAKNLRGLLSSKAGELDKLKDEVKSKLDTYNRNPTPENKDLFMHAFEALRAKSPPWDIPAAIQSWGGTDNPEAAVFAKKIKKLQEAYDILKKQDS